MHESSLHPSPEPFHGESGELKPCPFCGDKPFYCAEPNVNGPKYPTRHKVWCENLDCPVGAESDEDSREGALKAWNTRTPDPESAAEIERLRRELGDATLVLTEPAAFHLHALRNNILSRMNALHLAGATDYGSLKDRALTAESLLAAACENAAKTCVMIVEEECYLDREPHGMTARAMHRVGLSIRDRIAAVLRAAGEKRE